MFPKAALSLLQGTHCVVGSGAFQGARVAPALLRGECVGPCRYRALGRLSKSCCAARPRLLFCSVILLNGSL